MDKIPLKGCRVATNPVGLEATINGVKSWHMPASYNFVPTDIIPVLFYECSDQA